MTLNSTARKCGRAAGLARGSGSFKSPSESIGAFLITQKHVITFLYDKPPGNNSDSLKIYDGNQVWLNVDTSRLSLKSGVRELKRWETRVLAKAMYAFNQVVNGPRPNTLTTIGR